MCYNLGMMENKTPIKQKLNRIQRAERRKAAIGEIKKGKSQSEVARQLGVTRGNVHYWWKEYKEKGASTLKPRFSHGRPTRLDADQRRQLKKMILEGPVFHGWKTDLWTTKRIARLVRERFGVSYHYNHVGKLLHQIGLSWQKPQRRAAERDEKEIQRWIKEEWPRIKKKSLASARP
jgi:transposase